MDNAALLLQPENKKEGNVARFVPVSGSSGNVFFVNVDHIRMLRPSKDPKSSRVIFMSYNGAEEAISVLGTPSELARQINGSLGEPES